MGREQKGIKSFEMEDAFEDSPASLLQCYSTRVLTTVSKDSPQATFYFV